MKDLPLSPVWPFWPIGKSITYVESMRTWSSNPPPATNFFNHLHQKGRFARKARGKFGVDRYEQRRRHYKKALASRAFFYFASDAPIYFGKSPQVLNDVGPAAKPTTTGWSEVTMTLANSPGVVPLIPDPSA
jgi:hypothetical protein